MRLFFKLDYHTQVDELLAVMNNGERTPLLPLADNKQMAQIDLKADVEAISYSYQLEDKQANMLRQEWGELHKIALAKGITHCMIYDRWQDMPADKSFYTSLFTQSIFKRATPTKAVLQNDSLMVAVNLPTLLPTQHLVMVGGAPELGEWNPAKGIKMHDSNFPLWQSPSLKITDSLLASEYKFVIVESESDSVVAWEEGYNRTFAHYPSNEYKAIYQQLTIPLFKLAPWRGAGVAIPLFSLRSNNSMGVGEFLDLKLMVDWAVATGQKIIQILPINDSTMSRTWMDSYPYNANSIFALHPQYISLQAVGKLKSSAAQKRYTDLGKQLNSLEVVDYEAVNNLKENYLRQLYTESGEATLSAKDFQQFFAQNSYWLEPYALFSLLRDKYKSVEFAAWGDEAIYSQALQESYNTHHYNELAYYYFVQYHLHVQLVEAREYAQSKGVVFKGDIPIGVSRNSVDVWVNPHLFHLNAQAGAPPDDFSILGQNWGFPTYNWQEMAKDNYAWWSARFKKMAEYFDAYRIDHILGFFRIWEIPLDAVHGLLGYFNPALPYTAQEMKDNYGFYFEKAYTEPQINSWLLGQLFGNDTAQVAATYFDQTGEDKYAFKTAYNTQQKVTEIVNDMQLADKLLSLFNEVLFIEDSEKKEHYHPRISAQSCYKFRAMNEYDQARYNHLYNDFYYHRHNDYWGAEAMKKLPTLIESTNMLTCGEDLGMIPDCVAAVMESQQILSLEIQRMPKDPNLTFGEPWNYPYRSVCTTSTHDMNPLRAWLLEEKELSQRFLKEQFNIDYTIDQDCAGWVCEAIVKQHLDSPAMWTILPLQDWLSIDESVRKQDPESERINVPANSRHYWQYRMHCTLESLLQAAQVNEKMAQLINDSAR